jgi:alpha-methylacyl-CoA racemase
MSAGQRPLAGTVVLELGGLVAAPFSGMLLADMGADVIRVDRAEEAGGALAPVLDRGKRSIGLDLRDPGGVSTFLALATVADVVIDPFRPGVTERLGIGPAMCHERNPRLVFGRPAGSRRRPRHQLPRRRRRPRAHRHAGVARSAVEPGW